MVLACEAGALCCCLVIAYLQTYLCMHIIHVYKHICTYIDTYINTCKAQAWFCSPQHCDKVIDVCERGEGVCVCVCRCISCIHINIYTCMHIYI